MNIKKVKNIIKVKILNDSLGILKAERATVNIFHAWLCHLSQLPMPIQLTMNLYTIMRALLVCYW